MSPIVRRSAAAAAVVLALAAAFAAAKDRDVLRRWIDGPVRYIATADEIREFKALADDPARAAFIDRFWARRDPDPTTAANEYRQLFWERVRDANAKFTDSPGPGWQTDRGKIYILHGPPTEIREDLDAVTEDEPSAGRGLIRWTYEGRPEGRLDLDPVTVVAFYRTKTGEYKISYEPRLTSVFFDWMDRPMQGSALLNMIQSMEGGGSTQLGAMLDQGRMQDVPRQEEFLLGVVETTESFKTHALDARLDRFRSPDGPGTVAILTVPLTQGAPSGSSAILARFAPMDGRPTRTLAEGSFRVEDVGRDRVAQGRLTLDPGDYDVEIAVLDAVLHSNGIARFTMRAESPAAGLRTSDLVLARVLEPLKYKSLASYDTAFTVGGFRVVPLVGRALAPGEPVSVFFEIYGGTPPYRVTYRIEGKDDSGSWIPLGKPNSVDSSEGQQGWSFPTSDKWPRKDYRVRVVVEDRGGASFERDVPFRLADAAP